MGFIEFLIVVVGIVLVTAIANWIIGKIPGAPAIVPSILWVVAVCIILFILLTATGLLGHDVKIPHV